MLGLLSRNRDFRLLFGAQVVSYLGDWFADVALLGLVLDLTHSDLAASLVLVATTLPAFLVLPVAGTAVDRFDRRRLIVAVSVVQVGASLALLLVDRSTVWLAFVARGAISALSAFVGPAVQAGVPNVVDPADLATANAVIGSVWGAMLAVGAAVGGAFTVAFGRRASFLADAVTFVVAAALVAVVRRPMSEARRGAREPLRPLRDTREAFSYARHRPAVLALLCSKMGLGLAGGVVALLAVFATDVFRAGDAGIGLLLAARGAGAVFGPVVARRLMSGGTPKILLACGVAALVYGAGYALLPVSPTLALAFAAVFVAHLGGGAQWTVSTYGLQVITPDELRGRIFAADFALVTLTLSASFFLAGTASGSVGPKPVTFALAALSVAWGLLYLGLTRRLRTAAVPLPSPERA